MKISTVIGMIALVSLAALVIVWIASLLICENLTMRFGEQFEELYQDYTMISEVDYLKVLKYNDIYAEVYYVTKGACGNIVWFSRNDSQSAWSCVCWDTIWSTSGSAEGLVWPYIR